MYTDQWQNSPYKNLNKKLQNLDIGKFLPKNRIFILILTCLKIISPFMTGFLYLNCRPQNPKNGSKKEMPWENILTHNSIF